MNELQRILFLFSVLFSGLSLGSNKNQQTEFYRLSNIKGALVEGDCERYGGARFDGSLPSLALTLEKNGGRIGSYTNVMRYKRSVYVFWGYRSGIIETTVEVCVFKQSL